VNNAIRLTGWRLTAARILALILVIVITIYIFTIRDEAEKLRAYGYPGIFLISILANATLVLPVPGVAITFAMGAVLNPYLVALAAGAGSALGELTGYLAGFSGRGVISKNPAYERLKQFTESYGGLAILVMAFIPNPLFDLAGIAAGALRMPVIKFLFWAVIGKTLKMIAFAFAGAQSIEWLINLLG
jgi:membrane protein YqaA with SNARE-associated domain